MNRSEIIKQLIGEGFSEKTLIGFNDKQILTLHKTLFEQQVKGSVVMKKQTTQPIDVKKMTDTGINVELREKKKEVKEIKDIPHDNEDDKSDVFPTGSSDWKKKKKVKDPTMKEWVESLVEKQYHSLTTKNEIMKLIETKLNEVDLDETKPQTAPNPGTSPSPTTRPSTKPQKPKRENPFEPKHNPKPKAKTKLPKFMEFKNIGLRFKK